jgi:hypothetical protein
LGAPRKFKDSLTDRKVELWLTPAVSKDLQDFRIADFAKRLYGGDCRRFCYLLRRQSRCFRVGSMTIGEGYSRALPLERRQSFLHFVELTLIASGP